MKRGRGPGKKDKFAALPETFKDATAQSSTDELNKSIGEITKSNEQVKAAQKADQDVKEKKEAYGVSTRGYREAMKLNDLKIKYITRVLADKGDPQSAETIRLGLAGA
jgi:hypothetical protein